MNSFFWRLRKRLHSTIMETRKVKRVSMELKEQILQETIRQFQKSGLKFTMQDVAAGLHVAKKTIYQYYPSKEDLMLAVLAYAFEGIQQRKQEILSSGLPTVEKIARVMIAMPDRYELLDFRQLAGLGEKYPKAEKELRRQLESNWEPVMELIGQGIREGKIRNVNTAVVRALFTAGIEYFLSTDVLETNQISYNDGLAMMMDIIMKGITENENTD